MKKILSLILVLFFLFVDHNPAQAQYTWTITDCAYQRYLCENQGSVPCNLAMVAEQALLFG